MVMIDAEPLINYVTMMGGISSFNIDENIRRVWLKIQKRGTVSIVAADRLCIKVLGRNPAVIFGEAWWETDDYRKVGK